MNEREMSAKAEWAGGWLAFAGMIPVGIGLVVRFVNPNSVLAVIFVGLGCSLMAVGATLLIASATMDSGEPEGRVESRGAGPIVLPELPPEHRDHDHHRAA
jgi:hypothetical protein